jgi:hypothetical protein
MDVPSNLSGKEIMISKILQIIRTQPVMLATFVGVCLTVLIVTLISQKKETAKRPVYQWEIEAERMERQMKQFSDLVEPPQKK